MSTPPAADRARHLRHVLARRAADGAAGAESVESAGAGAMPHPDDVLARLVDGLHHLPPDEVGDPAAFQQALKTLLQHGEPALRKLLQPQVPDLSPDEWGSAEAVIAADGSRPSFLLREGNFPKDHPFLGVWHGDMTAFQPRLRKLAACVGRLQLPDGTAARYNGTGTLVDAGRGLVLTNFHVVEHARERSGVAMQADGAHLKVLDDWVIDFAAESGNPTLNRWRIKEVRLPAGAGASFAGLDAAVLQIEPFDAQESELPEPAVLLSGDLDYASGAASPTLVTIGFPGQPDTTTPPGATIDWNFVIKTLFNNRFGLKRVAPGEFRAAAGTVAHDHLGHVLSHDATTFGGASGSLLFAWKDDASPAFGLHFAGLTGTANYAVSLQRAAQALKAVGLDIR